MPNRLCRESVIRFSRPGWIRGVVRGCMAAAVFATCVPLAMADATNDLIQTLRQLQASDEKAQQTASAVVKQLANAKDVQLMEVLTSMKDATPIGRNWLMGVANALHTRPGSASKSDLEAFLADQSQDSEARYTVFRWLSDDSPELRAKMLDAMLLDSSLEIRFDAVAHALAASESLAVDRLQQLLDAARHPDQVASIISQLDKAGVKVDQARHFGFLTRWKLIGPFDNVGSDKFDVAYAVEKDWSAGSVGDNYEGKAGSVQWVEHATEDASGQVDLAKVFNNEKGCIVYGATSVMAPSPLDCEIRVGCINAQKVWVNGELVIANEVYHTGMQVDQYSAPIRLKAGENRILVKVCQNEQKEAWAQTFVFQLRLCDATGKAVLNQQ